MRAILCGFYGVREARGLAFRWRNLVRRIGSLVRLGTFVGFVSHDGETFSAEVWYCGTLIARRTADSVDEGVAIATEEVERYG